MKKIFFLFLISFLVIPYLTKADSTKIYNKGYSNPLNVLNSFLWNEKKGGKIGLTSKINIKNRKLEATIHPVLLDSSKIKIALSKIRYIDEEKQFTDFIFNKENLEVLSKYTSKGLLLANKRPLDVYLDNTFKYSSLKIKSVNCFSSSIYLILLKAVLILDESNDTGCIVAFNSLFLIDILEVKPILPFFFSFHKNELSTFTGLA